MICIPSAFSVLKVSFFKGVEDGIVCKLCYLWNLTLYLICQFWAHPIQQKKKWCQKYRQNSTTRKDVMSKI